MEVGRQSADTHRGRGRGRRRGVGVGVAARECGYPSILDALSAWCQSRHENTHSGVVGTGRDACIIGNVLWTRVRVRIRNRIRVRVRVRDRAWVPARVRVRVRVGVRVRWWWGGLGCVGGGMGMEHTKHGAAQSGGGHSFPPLWYVVQGM